MQEIYCVRYLLYFFQKYNKYVIYEIRNKKSRNNYFKSYIEKFLDNCEFTRQLQEEYI